MKKLKSYEQLEKEFNIAVYKLQKECKHLKLTEWSDEWWAVGHGTGRQVRYCKFCRKKVEVDDTKIQNWRRQQIEDNPIRWRKYSEKQKKDWIEKGHCSVPDEVVKRIREIGRNKKTKKEK